MGGEFGRKILAYTRNKLRINQRKSPTLAGRFNLLKPTGYVMHQQFNIQQL